jgi:hypothetical protein
MNATVIKYVFINVKSHIVKNAMVLKYVFINVKNKIAKNVKVKIYANIIVEDLCVMNVVIDPNFANITKINTIVLIVKQINI